MAKKLTWQEKLKSSKPSVVEVLDKNFAGMHIGQKMLVPSAALIDDFIRCIPEGESLDVVSMRESLAKQQLAEVCCPIATGFGLKIVAEAAFEQINQGKACSEVSPVWRVLDAESSTLKKVSFDPQALLKRRAIEGI